MRDITGGKLRYKAFGPFPFPIQEFESHKAALKQFWTDRKKDSTGLNGAVGIYVWTYEVGGERLPWNVGQTSRQGFEKRFRQKGSGFRHDLSGQEVYLLALRTAKEGFRRPKKSGSLAANVWLEKMLIASAIKVNPELDNVAASKYLRNAIVEGYWKDDDRNRSKSARAFSNIFKPRKEKRK